MTAFAPLLASLLIDAMWKGPILVSGPIWALAIVAYRNSTGRGRVHYLFIAAVVAATLFVPLFIEPGKATLNLFFMIIGSAYAVGGLLDHRELRRILRPLVED